MPSSMSYGINMGDLNRDGNVDLVAVSSQSTVGNGDGTFQAAATIDVGVGGKTNVIAVVDKDDDGLEDVYVAHESRVMAVCPGDGTGTFKPFLCIPQAPVLLPSALATFTRRLLPIEVSEAVWTLVCRSITRGTCGADCTGAQVLCGSTMNAINGSRCRAIHPNLHRLCRERYLGSHLC